MHVRDSPTNRPRRPDSHGRGAIAHEPALRWSPYHRGSTAEGPEPARFFEKRWTTRLGRYTAIPASRAGFPVDLKIGLDARLKPESKALRMKPCSKSLTSSRNCPRASGDGGSDSESGNCIASRAIADAGLDKPTDNVKARAVKSNRPSRSVKLLRSHLPSSGVPMHRRKQPAQWPRAPQSHLTSPAARTANSIPSTCDSASASLGLAGRCLHYPFTSIASRFFNSGASCSLTSAWRRCKTVHTSSPRSLNIARNRRNRGALPASGAAPEIGGDERSRFASRYFRSRRCLWDHRQFLDLNRVSRNLDCLPNLDASRLYG